MIKNIIISFLIGALLLFLSNYFIDISWNKEGSLDIVSGAIFEFFILQILLHFHSMRQDNLFEKKLNNHLNRIEQLIKKANIKIDEIKE